ncbi:MAG: D-alanyl-D-alanine carboxypeptidase [Alphaproteobacteria bacterium]|nr:D-alanyl-D-alanine carboxypeptidase [Alphaproteobacteria bacterium]
MFLVFVMGQPAFARGHALRSPYPPGQISSIVIDAQTGKVLSEHDADRSDYPASLTKMMTLYLAFGALEQGKISLNDEFTVSLHGARQAPSKLGLRPGQRIAVRDLILAVVTHSANDAAVTIAENLAGSESAFAQRMTATAHALGMTATTFRNASGLPNPPNISTARDLATLARALWRDYPTEYHFFATEEFTYKGAVYETHNHLMANFAGMDGIKTGYIHASGFNLAASAVRNGRRLIGVIMGGSSARARDLQMAGLLDTAFAGVVPAADTTVQTASGGDAAGVAVATNASSPMATLNPVQRAEAAVPQPAVKPPTPTLRALKKSHAWEIQVGAFGNQGAAEHAGALALARLHLKGKTALVVPPARGDKDPLYRARIAGFSQIEAERACRLLRAKVHGHKLCAVIAPVQAIAAALPAPRPLDLHLPAPASASAAAATPTPASAPAPATDANPLPSVEADKN